MFLDSFFFTLKWIFSPSCPSRQIFLGYLKNKTARRSAIGMLFVPTQKNFGEGLCTRSTFFFFLSSVFSDFEIDDFWHLWYIIVKPLKSLFICTKGSLLVLFVWKLRGFKVLKNEQMNSEMRWTASISSFHLSPHMYKYKR